MVPIAIRRAATISGFFVVKALKAAVPIFRAYLPESWRREQFERWLQQHSGFFALELDAAVPPKSLSDAEP
jgi:hypothetical protein